MCFVAGTPIQTEQGWKPIEQIRPGDKVLSRNQRTGEVAVRRVLSTEVTHPTTLHHVQYRTGNSRRAHAVGAVATVAASDDESGEPPSLGAELICTAEHPFFAMNRGNFVPAGSLRIGDELLTADGGMAIVIGNTAQLAENGESFTTYNFEVEEFHTYFAGIDGIWVHNSGRECERIFTLYQRTRDRLNLSPMDAMEATAKKLPKAEGRAIADSWVAASKEQFNKVHLDIGGEGRYADAINVNPQSLTSTTGVPGQPIPQRVNAFGEKLPFANKTADAVTLESAPIKVGTANEIARVAKPGSTIRLVSPTDYAIGGSRHQLVIDAIPWAIVDQSQEIVEGISVTTTFIRVP